MSSCRPAVGHLNTPEYKIIALNVLYFCFTRPYMLYSGTVVATRSFLALDTLCLTAARELRKSCPIEHPLGFRRQRFHQSFLQIEKLVVGFVEQARKVSLPVTRDSIQSFGIASRDKLLAAPSTSAEDKKKLENFGASVKWARNFISRHGMSSTVLHGEAGSVDAEAISNDMEAIRAACLNYDIGNIFNVDETGIFFRLLPHRTYLSTSENRKTARGTKSMKAKDRVSAYMCTNATGTGKVPMAIIGKSKSPRCFRVAPCPIKYFSQANAWSDSATFKRWWLEVFLPFIRQWTHLPVLLLMDGCASHEDLVDPRGQVTTMVYPPNCTSKHQPQDMGIIAATKRYYRRRFLAMRTSTMSVADKLRQEAKQRKMVAGTMGLAEGHPAHILDAADLLEAAWKDVTPETIARYCNFVFVDSLWQFRVLTLRLLQCLFTQVRSPMFIRLLYLDVHTGAGLRPRLFLQCTRRDSRATWGRGCRTVPRTPGWRNSRKLLMPLA